MILPNLVFNVMNRDSTTVLFPFVYENFIECSTDSSEAHQIKTSNVIDSVHILTEKKFLKIVMYSSATINAENHYYFDKKNVLRKRESFAGTKQMEISYSRKGKVLYSKSYITTIDSQEYWNYSYHYRNGKVRTKGVLTDGYLNGWISEYRRNGKLKGRSFYYAQHKGYPYASIFYDRFGIPDKDQKTFAKFYPYVPYPPFLFYGSY